MSSDVPDRRMKLAVLGATGPSGVHFVQQALEKGHEVVAIVRNPDKVKVKNENLTVVVADIFNEDELATHMTSCDAVVSCLGASYSFFSAITLYTQSAKSIVAAMTKANITRFVFMSSWFTDDKEQHPFIGGIAKFFLRQFLPDLRAMEKYLLEECSAIEFTSVRPPGLTNGELDEREALMEPDKDYSPDMKTLMPRANVAQSLLNIVENNLFARQCVAIGLPK